MGEGELVRDYDVRVRLEGGLIRLTKSGVVAQEWGGMIVEVDDRSLKYLFIHVVLR